MTPKKNFAAPLVAICALQLSTMAHSQPSNVAPVEQRFPGVWLVEAEPSGIVRALKINSVTTKADGGFDIDATYSGAPAKVSIAATTSSAKVEITTAAGSLITLTESSPNTLSGVFSSRSASGTMKARKFESLQNQENALKCGLGKSVWEGRWSQGNFGVQTLLIGEVDSNCNATVSYGPLRETIIFSGGAFSFKCNASTGGTCSFKPAGKDLWAVYSNPQGGANNAVFKAVN